MNGLIEIAAPAAGAGMSDSTALVWAGVLMLLAAALAITEFLVVSWGMLLVAAATSCLAAVALAFHVGTVAGWIFVVLSLGIAMASTRIGLGLMRRNRATVVTEEITADAGYRHAAEAAGIAVGALGELTTPATPSGRARFAGRSGQVELDVRIRGHALESGDRVVVLAIDGPVITVAAVSDPVSAPPPTHP